jgi:hypothetical protein
VITEMQALKNNAKSVAGVVSNLTIQLDRATALRKATEQTWTLFEVDHRQHMQKVMGRLQALEGGEVKNDAEIADLKADKKRLENELLVKGAEHQEEKKKFQTVVREQATEAARLQSILTSVSIDEQSVRGDLSDRAREVTELSRQLSVLRAALDSVMAKSKVQGDDHADMLQAVARLEQDSGALRRTADEVSRLASENADLRGASTRGEVEIRREAAGRIDAEKKLAAALLKIEGLSELLAATSSLSGDLETVSRLLVSQRAEVRLSAAKALVQAFGAVRLAEAMSDVAHIEVAKKKIAAVVAAAEKLPEIGA